MSSFEQSRQIKMLIPEAVATIILKLNNNGYEAYAVGGCVRDRLLKKEPKDWDVTTSATPEQVKALFYRTIDTGVEHGTVTVMINHVGYEVTTYRIDGEYEDHRRPKEVVFTNKLYEDLCRRDFTINAMAYSPNQGLVDCFGGMEDLHQGIIKAVGDPVERFTEDALRMLRAIRFSAVLGFEIDPDTQLGIHACKNLISRISQERIRVELEKTLLSQHPEKILELHEYHLMEMILPEFVPAMTTMQYHPRHLYSVAEHTIKAIACSEPIVSLRLALLFHDLGKPKTMTVDSEGINHFRGHEKVSYELAKEALKRLKYDNKTIDLVLKLVIHHDRRIHLKAHSLRKLVNTIGVEDFELFLDMQICDLKAQNPIYATEDIDHIQTLRSMFRHFQEEKHPFNLKDLALNGRDLMDQGVSQGARIGEILKLMLEDVLEFPEHNTKEYLLQHFKQYFEG